MFRPHMGNGYPQRASGATLEVSVVLPCFNEAESVPELTAELNTVLDRLGLASEILFINDASTDHTLDVLRDLQQRYPRVKIINHQQRAGQSAGHASGFRFARGLHIVTMDADGQNDPSDMPRYSRLAHARCRVASRQRQDSWVVRVSSRIANRFRNAITREHITDAGCAYRALRRSVLSEIPVFNGIRFCRPAAHAGLSAVEMDQPSPHAGCQHGINNRGEV